MGLRLILVFTLITGLVGLIVLALTLFWPSFRAPVSRLPALFGVALLLGSVFTLASGLMITTGQPWPEATNYIESCLFFVIAALGISAANSAWLIAKAELKDLSWWLGIAGLVTGLLALVLTGLPLGRMVLATGAMEKQMQQGLGENYAANIPEPFKTSLTATRFDFVAYWRGLNIDLNRYRLLENITYRVIDNEKLQLDVYQPANISTGDNTKLAPALLVIHGGGWQAGNRREVNEFNRYMATKGWVVFAVDYRLAPRYTYPAPQEDITCALAFIAEKGRQYHADVNHLAIVGRSAGGSLALTAAYNPKPVGECAAKVPPVRAVVAFYPPTDLSDPRHANNRSLINKGQTSLVESHMGGTLAQLPEQYKTASPITYAANKVPPTLLLQSGHDQYDLATQAQTLADKLRANGNPVVLLKLPWAGHAFDVVFEGISNQPALYYTQRFLAYTVFN